MKNNQEIIKKFDEMAYPIVHSNTFPEKDEQYLNMLKDFLKSSLTQQKEAIKTDLLKVADEGEYEDLRREVERYFK